MKNMMLIVLLIAGAGLSAAQQPPGEHETKQKMRLDARVRGLEEKLRDQQFEIDQLKKALLASDEQLQALSDLIDGEAANPQDEAPGDNSFDLETDACHSTLFVRQHGLRPRPKLQKARMLSSSVVRY